MSKPIDEIVGGLMKKTVTEETLQSLISRLEGKKNKARIKKFTVANACAYAFNSGIDENPFIMKKNNWLWRMAGGKMSQADYMKQKVLLQAKIAICDYLLAKSRLKMPDRGS